jgi:hypothetical protein
MPTDTKIFREAFSAGGDGGRRPPNFAIGDEHHRGDEESDFASAPRATTPRLSFVSQLTNNESQEHGEKDKVGCDLDPGDGLSPLGVADSPEYPK